MAEGIFLSSPSLPYGTGVTRGRLRLSKTSICFVCIFILIIYVYYCLEEMSSAFQTGIMKSIQGRQNGDDG